MSFVDSQVKSGSTLLRKKIDTFNNKHTVHVLRVVIESGSSTVYYSNGDSETYQGSLSEVSTPTSTTSISDPLITKVDSLDMRMNEMSNKMDAIYTITTTNTIPSTISTATTTPAATSTTASIATTTGRYYDDLYIKLPVITKTTSTSSTLCAITLMKEMIENMKIDAPLYPHPIDPGTDLARKQSFLDSYTSFHDDNTSDMEKGKKMFEAGFRGFCKKSNTAWTQSTNIQNFLRSSKIYYELVNLVVSNTLNLDESGEQWRHNIKESIFTPIIYPANLKDINTSYNWDVIKESFRQYIREQQLHPQQQDQQQQDQQQQDQQQQDQQQQDQQQQQLPDQQQDQDTDQ